MRKYISRQIDKLFELGRPVIIVFREKHSDIKFACLNRNELEHICLDKLWERYHMGYYCDFGDDSQPPNPPPVSKDFIETLPDGVIKDAAVQEWKSYEAKISWSKEENEQLKLVETSLRERDGTTAFAILRDHEDGEYEGFEVELATEIENPPKVDLLKVKPDWVTEFYG